eukprot:91385_1
MDNHDTMQYSGTMNMIRIRMICNCCSRNVYDDISLSESTDLINKLKLFAHDEKYRKNASAIANNLNKLSYSQGILGYKRHDCYTVNLLNLYSKFVDFGNEKLVMKHSQTTKDKHVNITIDITSTKQNEFQRKETIIEQSNMESYPYVAMLNPEIITILLSTTLIL